MALHPWSHSWLSPKALDWSAPISVDPHQALVYTPLSSGATNLLPLSISKRDLNLIQLIPRF